MIERKKWGYLAEIRARTGARTLYVNATPKGVYEWDLGAINCPEWRLMTLPDKTDFAGAKQIEKLVGFLDIADSRCLLI